MCTYPYTTYVTVNVFIAVYANNHRWLFTCTISIGECWLIKKKKNTRFLRTIINRCRYADFFGEHQRAKIISIYQCFVLLIKKRLYFELAVHHIAFRNVKIKLSVIPEQLISLKHRTNIHFIIKKWRSRL